jgi:2-polyprenyl-3-methyl-5-hydroxy-6-metoxy-1,4-benzoquinol methylase
MNITTTLKEHGNIESCLSYFLKFNAPREVKILDIGCNYGSLLYKLHSLGYDNIQGIDINNESIELGKRQYKDISNKIRSYPGDIIPFDDKSFDIVLMFDVIEHIPNIQDFLANQVYRVLKNGGRLIFQTPNKIINIPWMIIFHRSFINYKKHHCSLQTKNSLRTILKNAKFEEITISKYNIVTDHNKKKMKKAIGIAASPLLYILQSLPLVLFPNFWGNCKK